jgi:hypothetical protein
MFIETIRAAGGEMKFIKLTTNYPGHIDGIWVNMDKIIKMFLLAGETRLVSENPSLDFIDVKESPEEIIQKIKEAEK